MFLAAGTGVCADILGGFTTRMWMQLKPDLDRQKLAQELCLLDPYMLLNLRKLRSGRCCSYCTTTNV